MGAWIESIHQLSIHEFGAMPPPVAEAEDLVASTPVVV
jgi:hypothetical protein